MGPRLTDHAYRGSPGASYPRNGVVLRDVQTCYTSREVNSCMAAHRAMLSQRIVERAPRHARADQPERANRRHVPCTTVATRGQSWQDALRVCHDPTQKPAWRNWCARRLPATSRHAR